MSWRNSVGCFANSVNQPRHLPLYTITFVSSYYGFRALTTLLIYVLISFYFRDAQKRKLRGQMIKGSCCRNALELELLAEPPMLT